MMKWWEAMWNKIKNDSVMVTFNNRNQLVIVDTESRFGDAKAVLDLYTEIVEVLQLASEQGMELPSLHHFLSLLLPTRRQMHAMVCATHEGVDTCDLPYDPNASFRGLVLDLPSRAAYERDKALLEERGKEFEVKAMADGLGVSGGGGDGGFVDEETVEAELRAMGWIDEDGNEIDDVPSQDDDDDDDDF